MFLKKAALPDTDIYGRSMRWDGEYVVLCAMLKMKNSSVYRELKEKQLLPMASEDTIRRVISSVECTFGLNELALFNLGEELKGLPEHERWVSLMWDEVKIRESMTWCQRTMRWKGPVDLGGMIVECDVPDSSATHCLFFMIRLYHKNGVQVFAIFAVHNACSGEMLSILIVKCIIALYKVGALVKSTVCDGCASNTKAYLELGVSGKLDCLVHSFEHPADSKIKVHCLKDTPHLEKTSRNQVISHKKLLICQDPGVQIFFFYDFNC